jgi:hypothetical protein
MNLSADTLREWPKCSRYLQNLATTLDAKVKNAYLDACKADVQRQPLRVAERIALEGLKFATHPLVKPLTRQKLDALVEVDACGFQVFMGAANELWVYDFLFDAAEYCAESAKARCFERLEAIVLHELVHWARQKAGATDLVIDGSTPIEAGTYFETLAYGKRHCSTVEHSDSAFSLLPSGEQKMVDRKRREAAAARP